MSVHLGQFLEGTMAINKSTNLCTSTVLLKLLWYCNILSTEQCHNISYQLMSCSAHTHEGHWNIILLLRWRIWVLVYTVATQTMLWKGTKEYMYYTEKTKELPGHWQNLQGELRPVYYIILRITSQSVWWPFVTDIHDRTGKTTAMIV